MSHCPLYFHSKGMSMRFLHTSDWHLGRALCGERLLDDQRHVLAQLLAIAKDFRPAAVLVAGDLYDRAVPSPEAVRLLDDVISELVLGLGVSVFLMAGNHDSAARLSFGSRVMARNRLHMAGSLREGPHVVRLADEHGGVAFCTVPYAEPALAAEELACPSICDHDTAMRAAIERIHEAAGGARSVLMAHASVPGAEESESERSLTVGRAGTVGADAFEGFGYVALGHLHRAQTVGEDRIRYSGSILKYGFSEESQTKSVELVEMDRRGRCRAERVALTPLREVRTLRGTFDELVRNPGRTGREDLLSVTLLDATPILDAKLRLGEVYPNVLQVEQPNFLRPAAAAVGPNYAAMGDSELFAAFFRQVTGRELDVDEAAELDSVLECLRASRREVTA
jgi:exonuclease SbcD